MKNITLAILLFLIHNTVFGQNTITLDTCYKSLVKNYPLLKQKALLDKQNALDVEVIKLGKKPKFDASAQATYQSAVTELPISLPNMTIDPASKGQYKATASVNHLIYDGGLIDAAAAVKRATVATQKKQLDVTVSGLKNQINQLYFSIILLHQKKDLLNAKKKQLEAKIEDIKAGISLGVILPKSEQVLEAEILKLDLQFLEIEQSNISLKQTLSSLTGLNIDKKTVLSTPKYSQKAELNLTRPVLELFELQKNQIQLKDNMLAKQNGPKFFGFATGGIGNPGLNMLDNTIQGFYIIGVKAKWVFYDWHINDKQRASLMINTDIVENQKELFYFNTNIKLAQQQSTIDKIKDFIEADNNIIQLRKEILENMDVQLKNDLINTSTYVTAFTDLFEAQNNLKIHETQLSLAIANYNTIQGY